MDFFFTPFIPLQHFARFLHQNAAPPGLSVRPIATPPQLNPSSWALSTLDTSALFPPPTSWLLCQQRRRQLCQGLESLRVAAPLPQTPDWHHLRPCIQDYPLPHPAAHLVTPPPIPSGLAPPLFSAAGSNAWHTNYITAMQAGLILLLHFFSVPCFSVALAVCAYVCVCACVCVSCSATQLVHSLGVDALDTRRSW